MRLTRRNFIHANCTVAAVTLIPHFLDVAKAGRAMHGAAFFAETSRSSINVPGFDTWSYAFIDHTRQSNNQWSPTSYGAGTGWQNNNLPQFVDANGWVNKDLTGGTTLANTEGMGNGTRIPSTSDYSGAWVLKWLGNATIELNVNDYPGVTWTVDNTTALGNTTSTYTRVGNQFTNVNGQNAVVVVKAAGYNGPMLIRIIQSSTGPTPFMTNLEFFRVDDLTDHNNGLIFRRPFKQQYINYNPHSIRVLDWSGANNTPMSWFSHRNKPSYASWNNNYGACGQPKYGVLAATGGASNQWELDPAGVSGMPVTMQHGETCTARTILPTNTPFAGIPLGGTSTINVAANALVTIDLTQVGFGGRPLTQTITGLLWSGGVATATVAGGHGFTVGSVIQLAIAGCTPSGYNQANATCTITTSTQFTYVIANPGPSTVLGTLAGHGYPNGEKVVLIMCDRVNSSIPTGMTQMDRKVATVASATPSTFLTGIPSTGFSAFTTGYICNNLTINVGARGIYPLVLTDGNSPALKYHPDSITAGTYMSITFDSTLVANAGVTGAWVAEQNCGVLSPGTPIEIFSTLINELMAMGPTNPINLYVTLPPSGMISADNNYSSALNMATGVADILLNPASTNRAATYAVLDSRCKLYIEHANETWQGGNYNSCLYQQWRSFLAFGTAYADVSTYSSIRAVQTIKDIKAAFPSGSYPQLKYILGAQSSNGTGAPNDIRLNGNVNTTAALSSAATPLSYFDYMNFACYANNNETTPANSLTTGVAAFQAANGNAAAEEAAFLAWCQGFQDVAKGGGLTINGYLSTLTTLAAAVVAQGKQIKGYEGGFEPAERGQTQTNFSVVNGSNSVTATTSFNVGDYVTGPGWPVNTKITGNSGTALTMNNNFAGPTVSNNYTVISSPTAQFQARARGSQSWATIHRTWFDGAVAIVGSIAPAEFITYFSGGANRWYHTFFPDTYLGGVENAGLDLDYINQGNRNRGL